MGSKPSVLIITGNGLNCEAESQAAWERSGAVVRLIHLNDLLASAAILQDHQALMFIGGFSYGDHMGSGLVMGLRIRNALRAELSRFIESGGLILGVCNGFQVMIKIGLLPGLDGDYFSQRLALMQNDSGHFRNDWVELKFESNSPCVFTRGLDEMSLPIRHGEGKVFTPDRRVIEQVEKAGCVACRYTHPETGEPTNQFPWNPNGSQHAIAGLCDPSGRVFGLMPHPEAYLLPENHPAWSFDRLTGGLPRERLGLQLFRNAVDYMCGSG
jgi:phosphoribosylformylglycinamidine synthase